MKKIIFALLLVLSTAGIAIAGNGTTKHKGAGGKKTARLHVKRSCPNRPGCICH